MWENVGVVVACATEAECVCIASLRDSAFGATIATVTPGPECEESEEERGSVDKLVLCCEFSFEGGIGKGGDAGMCVAEDVCACAHFPKRAQESLK